jgi:multidrug efflux pump subunit AcrA (membrane-fusion protein)
MCRALVMLVVVAVGSMFVCCACSCLQVLQKERQLAQLAVSEQQALRAAEAEAAEQLVAAQQAATVRQRDAAAQIAELSGKLEAAEAAAAGGLGTKCDCHSTGCLLYSRVQLPAAATASTCCHAL